MTVTSPPNDGARPIAPPLIFETLKVSREGAVLFAEIAAPPMNLLGPELVRDLVSLIQRAEADEALKVLVGAWLPDPRRGIGAGTGAR